MIVPTLVLVLIFSSFTFLASPNVEAVDTVHEYKFHHHEDLTYDLNQWEAEYPNLMEVSIIGYSILGHELWNIHLTNFDENRDKELPKIYLDGGHHGNEYCGSEITILTLQYLIENYGTDPDVTFILDNSHVYVTPMINPDGIDLDTRFNANQVDLNRNYPYMWTPATTHGSGPGSEPEVAANIEFMAQHEFDLFITGHTGIVMLIYPWGYTKDPSPDRSLFEKIEEEVEDQWDIETGQSAVILYPAAGTGKDHGYAINRAPSWTFEVDDEQFVPVSGEAISERLNPIFECYMYLMKESITQKWWANVNVNSAKVAEQNGDDFTMEFNINNTGYADVVNGTATLEVGGQSIITNFSVGQFNETNLSINGTGDWTGKQEITLTLDYTKMTLNWSKPKSLVYHGSVEFDDDPIDIAVVSGGIAAVIILAVLLFVFVRRRNEGLEDESYADDEDEFDF